MKNSKTGGASLWEKVGYGFGDMSSSMFWKIFSYYLPIFYTNVFGLRPEHAAFLLLITKLYDAVSDPVMGIIADRTQTKWGKYRPYLLWIAIPFALCGILAFFTPQVDNYTLKHIYAYVTYILMMTAYTAINVPYGAMLGVVSSDPVEKSVFSSFRMFFAYIGSFISMGIFMVFESLSPGNSVANATPQSWTIVVTGISIACAVLFIAAFLMTKERVTVETSSSEGSSSILDDLKALGSNGPWWLLLGGGIGILLFNSMRGGAAAYYFSEIWGTNAIITCGLFLTLGEITQMVGVLLTVPVSGKIGKKTTFVGVLALITVLSVIVMFLPETTAGMWGLLVIQVLICLAIGINSPLLWSMFADVADYSEYKRGTASTGLIFSSSSMAQKFGAAFGSFFLLWVLALAGYDGEAAGQTPQALGAIRGLMSWIPAIGSALGLAAMLFYPLSDRKVKEIQATLAERRAK